MSELSIIVVLLEGLVSFFSPCVLPLLPVYMGILSNSSIRKLNDGKYDSKVLLLNTLSFTLGISTTFFILGTSITVLSRLLKEYSAFITLIGGILVMLMGLFYVGAFKSRLLNKDTRRISKVENATILSSFILGFTFSFGWTPCIGTVLTSVLLMASTRSSILISYILIGVYTIGFILPFIVLAIFYAKLHKRLKWFRNHLDVIKKIGGLIIIVSGLTMSYNGYIAVTDYIESKSNIVSDGNSINIYDLALKDQYGKEHKLSDYNGKTVFLNFWATWCPPCREEMPYIEELYKERDDVAIIGVSIPAEPSNGVDSIKSFLSENNYTFPTLFDIDGDLGSYFNIMAYPTTIIINKSGEIDRVVEGSLTKENMEILIDSAK